MNKDVALFWTMIGYLDKNNPVIISDPHDIKSVWVIQKKDTSESSYIYMQNTHLESTSHLSYSIETINNKNIVISKIAQVSSDEKSIDAPPAWETLQQLLQQHQIQGENQPYPEYAVVPSMHRLLELYPDIAVQPKSEYNMLLGEPEPQKQEYPWDALKRDLQNRRQQQHRAAIANCYWTIARHCSKEPEILTIQNLGITQQNGITPLEIIQKICAIQPISECAMEY